MIANRPTRPFRSGPQALRPLIACLGLLGLAGGCGGDDQPGTTSLPASVTGKVLLPDGNPVSGGKIVFDPDDEGPPKAEGTIKGDGTFSLENVTPGMKYLVWIDTTGSSSNLPTKYRSKTTTDLNTLIKPGSNALEPFKLDNKPPATQSEPGGKRVTD